MRRAVLGALAMASADELPDDPTENSRAEEHDAPSEVWENVIANHPQMKRWIAFNRTVPLELLRARSLTWAVSTSRRTSRSASAAAWNGGLSCLYAP